MLEQVGENVFFGPCASCPCMKGNSIENEVSELGADLQAAEKFETGIDKLVKEKIPVDIVMRVGQKGVNGRTGPVGFQGPDGPGMAPMERRASMGRVATAGRWVPGVMAWCQLTVGRQK